MELPSPSLSICAERALCSEPRNELSYVYMVHFLEICEERNLRFVQLHEAHTSMSLHSLSNARKSVGVMASCLSLVTVIPSFEIPS